MDTQALRQAAQIPYPQDQRSQHRLYVQNAQDLDAAADEIESLEVELADAQERIEFLELALTEARTA